MLALRQYSDFYRPPHNQQFWLLRVEVSHRPDFSPVTAAVQHTRSLYVDRSQAKSNVWRESLQCPVFRSGLGHQGRLVAKPYSLGQLNKHRAASQVYGWTQEPQLRPLPHTLLFSLGTNLSRQLRMAIQEASSLTIYNLQSSHINYQFTKCISQTFIVIQVPSADFTCSISLSKKTDTSIARTICNGILRESTYPTNLQAQNQTKSKYNATWIL